MSIAVAVDRLYQGGWLPDGQFELDRLPSGLSFPTVEAVRRIFADAGLRLLLKQNLMFKCHRAEWAPVSSAVGEIAGPEDTCGAVVGNCEREAAVYALAQYRKANAGRVIRSAV